jgi:hypothetical protein
MKTTILSLTAAAMVMAGCTLGSTNVTLGNHPVDQIDPATGLPIPPEDQTPGGPQDPNDPPAAPPRCDMGKQYVGFAGTMLEAGRVDNDLGVERGQVKPYTALQGEYTRVLGNTPALVATSAATFGQDPARWLTAPTTSAVTVYTSFRIAFQGCLTVTAAGSQYATMPTTATATTECTNWARKAWSRDATQPELDACVQVAMVDSVKEGANATTAPRRWAYTCASVMSAAGFMTF